MVQEVASFKKEAEPPKPKGDDDAKEQIPRAREVKLIGMFTAL